MFFQDQIWSHQHLLEGLIVTAGLDHHGFDLVLFRSIGLSQIGGLCDRGGLDTHMKNVWAPTAKDNSLHAARETSTSRGFAFTDIPSQKQPIQRLINGCFIDTVFFCTGTWSRSTTLEPFPSTFTEKFTDTWPMFLSPNGLQNTAKPHQNISRSRPKFKYGTFYKVITIPKTLTTSAIKQRRLCCSLSPDPNLWTSAATEEWIYSCHGQKFKIQASQVSLFQKRLFWLLQTSLKCP